MNIDDGPDLEDRYRRVLRLLPGYYRDQWEDDMVAAFLDSQVTGDVVEDEYVREFGRPAWPEVASVAALAVRLYLGGASAPRRYFAWGQAVRRAVLAVALVHATQGLADLTLLAARRHLAGWFPSMPASLAVPGPSGPWPALSQAADCAWIVIFVTLVLGQYRAARAVAALAVAASLAVLLHAQLAGVLVRPPGAWGSWFLLDLAPAAAMTAFHRDAPPAPVRAWLLALPGYYLLVPLPVLALQVTGNSAWLPDSAGLGCLVVSVACLAHAPRAQSGAGVSGLLITLPAAGIAALTAVTTAAYDARGAVEISVAGRPWAIPLESAPLTGGQFVVTLPTSGQASQLRRLLVPAG